MIDAVLLPSQQSSAEVRTRIQGAVSKGASVFNAGHYDQCCDIYMEVMNSIMNTGIAGADDHLLTTISDTMKTAENTSHARDRAWVLRRGLEGVYTRLGQVPMTQTIGN